MDPVKYIEDVPETPISRESVLSDEQLGAGGLVRTDAWVRTKSSKGALRVQKHRETKAATGCRQLNVVIPDSEREKFKEWARLASEGKPYGPAPVQVPAPPMPPPVEPAPDPLLAKLRGLTGWRRWLARLLGLLD